jgi:hypothetical protein
MKTSGEFLENENGAFVKKARNSAKRQENASKKSAPAFGNEGSQRDHMLAVAAYYLAKQRGFAPDNEISDWLQAEAELDFSQHAGR